jgi:hypothetical protein
MTRDWAQQLAAIEADEAVDRRNRILQARRIRASTIAGVLLQWAAWRNVRADAVIIRDIARRIVTDPATWAEERSHRSGAGRRWDLQAATVANILGEVYEIITKKKPGRAWNHRDDRPAGFQLFLAQMFGVLHIAASTERHARRLSDRRRTRSLS